MHSYARKIGLTDNEKDDIMQDMIEMVISQALYHFDGRFKLKTYLNRYFDQCKTINRKKREMLPLRSKVTKHARLYYEAKRELEADGSYVTTQKIADYVNSKSSKAHATCETVHELFNLGTVSLDAALNDDDSDSNMQKFLTNGSNISEMSPYSPMYDIEEHTIYTKLEKNIYDYIATNYSIEYANLYTMRHGLLDNSIHTYEQLVETTGYSKDILRRRFVDISENLKKEFAEAM